MHAVHAHESMCNQSERALPDVTQPVLKAIRRDADVEVGLGKVVCASANGHHTVHLEYLGGVALGVCELPSRLQGLSRVFGSLEGGA